MSQNGSAYAPRSLLRPYSHYDHAMFLPVLLKTSVTDWIPASSSLFLTHPTVVPTLVGLCSIALYYANGIFFSHLVVPGEVETGFEWQDNVALVLCLIPVAAGIVLNFFAVAWWLHKRIWTRVAERTIREVDVLDVECYYKGDRSGKSSFWCLEYEKQVAACFALDARNPGRTLKVFQDANFSGVMDKFDDKEVDLDADEDARDMALFRHANIAGTDGDQLNPETSFKPCTTLYSREFTGKDYDPVNEDVLPAVASKKDGRNVAQLRHFTIAENFAKTSKVELYLLKMAINTAFSATTPGLKTLDEIVLVLQPKLQKALRAAALDSGFRIVGRVPLDSISQTENLADAPKQKAFGMKVESFFRSVWPLSFSQEVLVLRKEDADKDLVRQ